MINTQGKLLISAFIIILLGVILIAPLADDVEEVSTGSVIVTNETLSWSSLTTAVSNESATLSSNATSSTGNLSNDDLTAFTAMRNETSEIVTNYCNITLFTGRLQCNNTGSQNVYVDYTYISGRTETFANDELTSLDEIRNATALGTVITSYCNVTLSTGGLICNNTHNATAFGDYTYTHDTYVRSSAARRLLAVTIIFFAITVLVIGMGYAWKAFKEGGVI